MDNPKKDIILRIGEKLLFVYFVIFPLGQLVRFNVNLLGMAVVVHPVDLIALISIPFFVLGFLKQPKFFDSLLGFLAVATFSLLLSLTLFQAKVVILGALYLLRFFAYATFFLLVWSLVREKKTLKETLLNSLVLVTFFVGIFGWIQYFWVPDLTSLKYIGWDDHLYRLVGTFLDPGFTSIIIVFGFLASFSRYLQRSRLKIVPLILFFLVTLAFTYARAAYLAFFIGSFTLVILNKKFNRLFWPVFTLLLIILLLPRPAGEGVKLERTHSIFAKAENYSQTLTIISNQPLFGVGFNNLCPARIRLFADSYKSHACSGADSSFLLVIAATGLTGFIVFLFMASKILTSVISDIYGKTFLAASAALLTHSIFVNSLFYSWIMGWMGVLLALSLKEKR